MPASARLNTWVAESVSWQSFVDFGLPSDAMASYAFVQRPDSFYLSLMSRTLEFLSQGVEESSKAECLSIAKGLEIFSLKEKRSYFRGVDAANNVLYASALYYLADYPASSWILANIFISEKYANPVDQFMSDFFCRHFHARNEYSNQFKNFLDSGDLHVLRRLIHILDNDRQSAFRGDAEKYISLTLAKAVLVKFEGENVWADLLAQSNDITYWKRYVEQSVKKKIPAWTFFPSQRQALAQGILTASTCSLQMPTSSGKTGIAELLIFDEFSRNPDCRILYLAPFRALASELKQTLAVSLGRLGIKSKTLYGGSMPTPEESAVLSDVTLLIATPEKFMAIEKVIPTLQNNFTMVVCDEGHLLDDLSRGLTYELLLSRLKNNAPVQRRFIFISAVIPNINTINSWLGGNDGTVISSTYRPTDLEYAFLNKMDRAFGYYLNVNPNRPKPENYQLYKYLSEGDLKWRNPESGKLQTVSTNKGISSAVAIRATKAGSVALFTPDKRGPVGVEGLTQEILNQLSWKGSLSSTNSRLKECCDNLANYFCTVFGDDYLLTEASRYGVLFHHGDLPQNVREIIEDSIREGHIRLVVCTNTLAEGVNLPIKTIVVHSTSRLVKTRNGSKRLPIPRRDLKNLVGRAGRAGKETKGMIIVPHSAHFQTILEFVRDRDIEMVKGQLQIIVQRITEYLKTNQLKLSSEILDAQPERFQELLDSIDQSIIDLLAEEVDAGSLRQIVDDAVAHTFAFHQGNDEQRGTLLELFGLRVEKLDPIVRMGHFRYLRNSGTNIRTFEDLLKVVDFTNEIWTIKFDPLDEKWFDFLFNGSIFKTRKFATQLDDFNIREKTSLDNAEIRATIELWMRGSWFQTISREIQIEMHQALRLINNFVGFVIQSLVASTIRLKELRTDGYVPPETIQNFAQMLQYGISSKLALGLFQMGLSDRVSVLGLESGLTTLGYVHKDYATLRLFLGANEDQVLILTPNRTK